MTHDNRELRGKLTSHLALRFDFFSRCRRCAVNGSQAAWEKVLCR